MGVPHNAAGFGDLLDKRVTKLFYDELTQLPDIRGKFFGMEKSNDSFERWSEVGALPDFQAFTDSVPYQSQYQGYATTATHLEFANGFQVTRDLYDDDRHGIWERRPVALANAYNRTVQKHGARAFNNAFSVDSLFYTNSEAVALCSTAHTTTSGASTSSGFSNSVTSAMSATSLAAARIQMRAFRGDQGERISTLPSKILIPPDLYDVAFEIVKSAGKPDTANNNANVHQNQYEIQDWEYLTDTNNWFLLDDRMMKQWLVWFDRVPLEFGMAEELDTLIAKWRAYCRYSYAWFNWRFILGANVS
jgi:hypothetical protein